MVVGAVWWWHPLELSCEKVKWLNIVRHTTRKQMSFTQHRVKLARHSLLRAPEKFSSDHRWGKISLDILCTCIISRWSDPIGRCRHWCSLCCPSLNCWLAFSALLSPFPPTTNENLPKILSVYLQHGENEEEKDEQCNYHTETHFNEYVFLIFWFSILFWSHKTKDSVFNYLTPKQDDIKRADVHSLF